MRRGIRILAWCLVFASIATWRQPTLAQQPAATAGDPTAVLVDCQPRGFAAVTRQAIREKLARLINLEFVETPWFDVLERIADLHGFQFQIDNNILEDAGAGGIAEVTVKLHGVTLDAVLRKIFGPMDLIYLIENEVVWITNKEQANRSLSLRLYRCNWTTEQVPSIIKTLSQAGRVGASKEQDALSLRDEFTIVTWGTTIVARATPLQHDAIERQLIKMRGPAAKRPVQAKQAAGSK